MKKSDIRKELHKYVDEADSESLKFFKEAIIAYQAETQIEEQLQPSFRPNTNEELIILIEQAEDNLKQGKYKSHTQVEAIMKSWHVKKK